MLEGIQGVEWWDKCMLEKKEDQGLERSFHQEN